MIDLFFVPLSLIIFTGIGQVVNYIEERKEKHYLKNAFGKYINKDLLEQIADHKKELKLGGDKQEITVFFSDIRGFTTLSEKLSPEKLVHLINAYFTSITEIILKHNGTVDKFIGDAIMAFWNAPLEQKDHAVFACACTLEQIKALEKLCEELIKQGYPEITIGCGLNTGVAVIGNMGSNDRFDYTAMGDTINLGSRLEGLTKQYGVSIIVSESTYEKAKHIKDFTFRKLDIVAVKGKNIPVTIYELCTSLQDNFNSVYETALELYLRKNFKKALNTFKEALSIKREDTSCRLFIERCKKYIKHPPEKDWDGAWVTKTK